MQQSNGIENIVAEYTPRLLRYIRSQVSSPEDAEDILQDVFYQLARASGDGCPGIERISSWLYRVARNSVLNFWRKKRDIPLETEDEICEDIASTLFSTSQDSPETIYLRRLVWLELDAALAELPQEQSEVFCMTVFDGIPVKNISKATGTPVATLLSRKYYAVKFLRKRFHDLYNALISQN
ncbi:MAG: sigma-70 family RNA polymerase sigma factor [Muribaculaceae bacterium]|nr:sigma-70 family RNA polymerase sigma factor [Muribaculaceae bacterium]MDE6448554.1 sigma-70 family RNA polymerase sigma factor [Muribaculaceae bacterium]